MASALQTLDLFFPRVASRRATPANRPPSSVDKPLNAERIDRRPSPKSPAHHRDDPSRAREKEARFRARLESGDEGAFEELVETYGHRVLRLVQSVLGPGFDAEAEELTQDVFLTIHRRLATFRGESALGTWIYRISYRKAVDAKRKPRLRLPHRSDDILRSFAGATERTRDLDRRLSLHSALEQLPDVYRTVLHLFYWQGCTVEEIGIYLAMPAGTIKSNLFRARRLLSDRLRQRGFFDE